jgi:hypothetical protein
MAVMMAVVTAMVVVMIMVAIIVVILAGPVRVIASGVSLMVVIMSHARVLLAPHAARHSHAGGEIRAVGPTASLRAAFGHASPCHSWRPRYIL